MIKNMPKNEQPREKFKNSGVANMSNAELLALILSSGNKENNVMDIANNILYHFNDIATLSDATLQELMTIKGVGMVKAMHILSAIELGKRAMMMPKSEIIFRNQETIYNYFKPKIVSFKEEHLYVIYLDTKGYTIDIKEIAIGTSSMTFIDSKIIFKWAYKLSSSRFILVHNHPSGDPYPSLSDIKATDNLIKKAKIIDFELLDHVIIGEYAFSMRQELDSYHLFD